MKLTKRMKNSIIQGLIANTVLFLFLIGGVFLYMYPHVEEIEMKKSELSSTFSSLLEVESKGISLGDFKKSVRASDLSNDAYTDNLVKNISDEFYSNYLTNTGSTTYSDFLANLSEATQVRKSSEQYIQKDQTLATILPIYDANNTFSDEGLSDFFFTNYVENVLYSFNLSAKGEIGIGALERQGGELDEKQQQDSLQEDIYGIPLSLEIEGRKKDVVDFVHFFENVGGIYISGDGFEIHSDDFVSRRLEGSVRSDDYNIYKNQVADISSLSLQDYPDSSSRDRDNGGLIEVLKGEQSREKMTMELELMFYVSGVPGYKMEKYVDELLLLYNTLSSSITSDAQKYKVQASKFDDGAKLLAVQNLQSLDSLMLVLQKDIAALGISKNKREDIQKTYEQALEYSKQIEQIQASYDKQLTSLKK